MRTRAVFTLILLFAAGPACSLDDAGEATAGSDAELGGSAGQGGTSGTGGGSGGGGGTSGTGGGVPQPCGGKCPKTNIKNCNTKDECECASKYLDLDPDPKAATCEPEINSVEIDVGITHDFVGHLTARLWGPPNLAGTIPVITLMSRPGFAELADDGTGSGPSANKTMIGSAPITFSGGGTVPIENAGSLAGGPTLCQGSVACNFTPSAGSAAGPSTLSQAFNGHRWSGTWKLCVGDSEPTVTGTLELFRVRVTTGAGLKSAERQAAGVSIPDDGYDGTDAATSMGCTTVVLN